MSQTEVHVGKLIPTGLEYNSENVKNILIKEKINVDEEIQYYLNLFDLFDLFEDLLYGKYFIYNRMIYKKENIRFVDDDIFEASENKDGSIEYVLGFYNGGCSFNEALEEALENMEK